MIKGYSIGERSLKDAEIRVGDQTSPNGLLWVDLLEPTVEEDKFVSSLLGVEIPTREEMQEIEVSSRLYEQDNALFMTASVLSKSETEAPESTAMTFILAADRLITVRYADPRSFIAFAARVRQNAQGLGRAELVLLGLLDAIVDRTADVLEKVGSEVEAASQLVFKHTGPQPTKSRDFQEVIRRIGRAGDLASKARESLVSIGRLASFLAQSIESNRSPKEVRARVHTIERDVHSLTDHATFLNNKINFLLDATLGMINIEQNNIIKIFSVAAVVFLPPTLVASVYGMNFEAMPELKWGLGYPMALGFMVLSALLPYFYFKRRGWL
jgi:magnesium transporter